MKLVYLWVEKYKNIEKQGFNFSPEFRCNYNPETNELKIEENKDYVNSFPENINITAIVGKNGSGKSSVLELISFLRFERIRNIINKKVCLVFQNKDKLYVISDNSIHSFYSNCKIINNTNYILKKESISAHELFELIMFTNGLYDFTMQDERFYIFRTSHFNNFYNGKSIYYKEKQDDKNRHQELNAKYAFLLKKDSNFFNFLDEKFLFDSMYLEIDSIRKFELFSYDEKYDRELKEINNFYNLETYFKSVYDLSKIVDVDKELEKKEIIFKFLSFYFLEKYIRVVVRFKHDMKLEEKFLKEFLKYILSIFNKETEKFICYREILSLTKKYFQKLNIIIKKVFKNKKGLLNDFELNIELLKYVTKFEWISKIIENNFNLKESEEGENFLLISDDVSIESNFLEKFYYHINKSPFLEDLYYSNIIRWEFFNKQKKYNYRKLSTGEKQLLEFIVSFAYTIKNSDYTDKLIIFLEEIEITMHPEWQRKLFNIIINILEKLNLINHKLFKFHFIITTHSPFLISDLPKQNIIFLDKDENGKCKVIDGLKEKKETFGANIHTLLSDSFFMEDGLIGEFAKEIIDDVINYLNGKKSKIKTDEEAQKIINIIGEPIIKRELKRMFDSKRLKKVNEIDKIKREMRFLKNRMKELERMLNEKDNNT